jgi:hypothetical protein
LQGLPEMNQKASRAANGTRSVPAIHGCIRGIQQAVAGMVYAGGMV